MDPISLAPFNSAPGYPIQLLPLFYRFLPILTPPFSHFLFSAPVFAPFSSAPVYSCPVYPLVICSIYSPSGFIRSRFSCFVRLLLLRLFFSLRVSLTPVCSIPGLPLPFILLWFLTLSFCRSSSQIQRPLFFNSSIFLSSLFAPVSSAPSYPLPFLFLRFLSVPFIFASVSTSKLASAPVFRPQFFFVLTHTFCRISSPLPFCCPFFQLQFFRSCLLAPVSSAHFSSPYGLF